MGRSVVSLSANVYYSVVGVVCHMLCRVYFIWLSHCLLTLFFRKFDFWNKKKKKRSIKYETKNKKWGTQYSKTGKTTIQENERIVGC